MNKELKAKWVEALRSGRYDQAKGELRVESPAQFCCLGVLCEVAGVPQIEGDNGYDFNHPRQSDEAVLYGKFAAKVHADEFQHEAARLNDEGKPFSEIAEWIEKNVSED